MANKTMKEILKKEGDAISILQDKNLLLNIVKEVKKLVAGNDDIILALINTICLRLVINANPTSSNVLVSDDSGSGKDWITKCVCDVLVPKTMYHHQTDISEKLLNYWTIQKKDGGTFDGRVLHLEDPGENVITSQAFKVRASGENATRFVHNGKARHIPIEGKPVLIVTSMKATIDNEGARRWDSLRMDKSKRVTQLMKKMYMEIEAGIRDASPDENLRNALQRNLLRKRVVIPFAMALVDTIPDVLIMRTQQQKLIDYIKASAVLHQYQRKRDEHGSVIATLDDYEYARFCFLILGDLYGMVLSRDEEEVIKVLKEANTILPIRELSGRCRPGRDWMYKHLTEMKEKGILKEESPFDPLANKPVQCFRLHPSYDIATGVAMPTREVVAGRLMEIGIKTDNQKPEGNDRKINKEGVGCRQFEVCVRELNELREKDGLSTFYYRSQNNRQPPKDINSSSSDNGSNLVIGKSSENQTTTTDNQTTLSLFQQIQKLREYVAENQNSGFKVDMAFLEYKFSKNFIQHCIDNKVIQKKGDDEWEMA